ncbi:hypothetical protein ABZ871_38200 [Streptomyces populi]
MAATVKHWVDLGKTALTERGKTRREQLRQDGETERARIAAGTTPPAAPTPEPPVSDEPPEDDAAGPGAA